jgi:hypothetical protein
MRLSHNLLILLLILALDKPEELSELELKGNCSKMVEGDVSNGNKERRKAWPVRDHAYKIVYINLFLLKVLAEVHDQSLEMANPFPVNVAKHTSAHH